MQRNATTRYPVLLVHGLFGLDRISGQEPFLEVRQALQAAGTQVFVPYLSIPHSNELRGEQLLAQIDRVLLGTGAARVNLIGHSQGALAARYAAALAPGKVASVTSVSGPNHGSELADFLLKALVPGRLPHRTARSAATLFCDLLSLLSGRPALQPGAVATLKALSTTAVGSFNDRFPQGLPATWGGQGAGQVNGVRYYSWAGSLAEDERSTDRPNGICRSLSRFFTTEAGQNDGFVGRHSSHLGTVIRSDYPLGHLESLIRTDGQRLPGPDPVGLYVEHAIRLREANL
ncbi:esterase/lipase family protein [Pseudomonas sp. NPDC089534]|uniref:esterase/lipase family protein n=1 Tax=Pseudomonas sp. NPDC089534 TaxID=3364468 RepID=UPI0038131589